MFTIFFSYFDHPNTLASKPAALAPLKLVIGGFGVRGVPKCSELFSLRLKMVQT
jgi:hypothetical protein